MTVGEIILWARVKAGLTQAQLSERAGINRQASISEWESGGSTPSADTFCRLLAAAGVKVSSTIDQEEVFWTGRESALLVVANRQQLYRGLNNAGWGGPAGDGDINELAGDLDGTLIHKSENGDDIAVYETGVGVWTLVGDSAGPWGVEVTFQDVLSLDKEA